MVEGVDEHLAVPHLGMEPVEVSDAVLSANNPFPVRVTGRGPRIAVAATTRGKRFDQS
jgi:hypothetical protein